jgi:hypothetical protein
MNMSGSAAPPNIPSLTNGSGAAAILAAGIGSFALAVLACAGDKSAAVKNNLNFYKPTGPLSGVTTVAILVWLLTWLILEWRWGKRDVAMSRINRVSLTLLVFSILLTFPPIVDFL